MDTSFNVPFDLLLSELDIGSGERRYFLRRFSREGISFTTKILPVLWKGCLKCIEERRFDPGFFMYRGGYPFNWKDPLLRKLRLGLEDLARGVDNPVLVYQLSQLCQYTYKLALPSSDQQLVEAADKFMATNAEVGKFRPDYQWLGKLRSWIETRFRYLLSKTADDFIGMSRDGSGNVAQNYLGFAPRVFKDTLDGICPEVFRSFSGIYRSRSTDLQTGKRVPIRIRKSYSPTPTAISFVPKDSRGPRTIGVEDFFLLKAQMGFHDFIKPILETLSHGRIQFTDQSLMQAKAEEASKDKRFSTLDLEEASDRHGFKVARFLYTSFPCVRFALSRFRNKTAALHIGSSGMGGRREFGLNAVAGMGSGLTFPLMAWTIYSAVCHYVEEIYHDDISSDVYVYGDDVIVPSKYYDDARKALEKVGLKVNASKSFMKGWFRESCGGDYFRGNTVTPVRLKLTFSDIACKGVTLFCDEQAVIRLERHCRELVRAGFYRLSDYYYNVIERATESVLPVSSNYQAPYLIRYRWDAHYVPDDTGHYGYTSGLKVVPATYQIPNTSLNRAFRSHLASLAEVSWERTLCVREDIPVGDPSRVYAELRAGDIVSPGPVCVGSYRYKIRTISVEIPIADLLRE